MQAWNDSMTPEDLRDEWRTPPLLFNYLNERVRFTIDAAASDENHLLPRYWSLKDNALSQSWQGETVWCNPPYSEVTKWVRYAHDQTLHNTVFDAISAKSTKVYMLVRSDLSTRWFHDYVIGSADLIIAIQPRVQFLTPIGYDYLFTSNSPAFGSIIVRWKTRSKQLPTQLTIASLDWQTHEWVGSTL